MGCDIHAFIEFLKGDSYWSLTRGTLNIPRDRGLFTALALGPGGIADELPYPPRGLPSRLSADALNYFYSPASEVQRFMEENYSGQEEFSGEQYAAAVGGAARQEFLDDGLLPAPELHSHSWLNLSELKEVLSCGQLASDKLSPEFRALLAAMEELAGTYKEVRLVFCFDG
jgi:hypothetical protein